jgi:hypothetical protein
VRRVWSLFEKLVGGSNFLEEMARLLPLSDGDSLIGDKTFPIPPQNEVGPPGIAFEMLAEIQLSGIEIIGERTQTHYPFFLVNRQKTIVVSQIACVIRLRSILHVVLVPFIVFSPFVARLGRER